MNRVMAVARRELHGYFSTPVAYVAVIFFLVVTSVWFFSIQQFFAGGTASLRGYFSTWPFVFIVLLPAITMRSWAEERRRGTAEVLLTLPVRERQLVMGKFLASAALLGLMAALTLPVPLSVAVLGPLEPGPVASQYLGALLLGCAGLAAGQFVSSLSTNQVSAFLLGVAFLLFISTVGRIPSLVVLPGWLARSLTWVSLDYHFESFGKGLFDSRDAVYFLVLTFAFLYFNTKVLYLRRFR